MLAQEQIQECQKKFNLSYHVTYAKICQDLIGFEGKNVLEVGGSLPPDFVFDYLGVKSWTGIETPDYEKSLQETGGLTHQGTIIKEIKNIADFKYQNKQEEKYNLYLENIEDLPEDFYKQYDLIFSIATFEHIHKLPLALDKMFYALKEGGKLFSMFSPIWSAHDGHHLPVIIDENGHKYNFGNSPIPPWGHLLMSRGEMAKYLYQKIDKITADQIVYYVYQSNHINRYFTEDYIQFIEQSLFSVNQLQLTFKTNISKEIESKLKLKYPDNHYFANNGILLVLEKDINEKSYSNQSCFQMTSPKPTKMNNYEYDDNCELTTPVAFIIFNRPDTTQKVFNAIREAKPPKLLVVADGARIDKEGEAELCQQTRAIIDQVDWDCEVLTNYSDVNLGGRRRQVSGYNWVFEQVEEAIILEDDCLPHPSFFRYCQELLEKYRDDKRIMFISGDNFQFGRKRTEYSYYFSRYSHNWGWATWRRAWELYDDEMKLWEEIDQNKWLHDILQDENTVNYWGRIFSLCHSEKFNRGWDYRFQFACWINNGLSILPNVNLISNIGFGKNAQNCTNENSPQANLTVQSISFPLNHPPFVIRDTEADNFTQKYIFGDNLKQSKSTNTNNITMITRQAINYLNQNQEIQALNLFEGILQNNSENMGSYYGKAVSLARLGSLNTAVETLEKLLTIQPQHKKARCLLEEIRPNNLDLLLEKSAQAIQDNHLQKAFNLLNTCKSMRERKRGLDLLRADCFLKMKQPIAALQSAYEELRYFPDNEKAQKLVEELKEQYGKFLTSVIDDPEFQELFQQIRPYTMVSEYRLYSLFSLTKKICQENIQGNFIECGVAGGGSTALMASVIKRYSQIPRKIYACDSFEGMPEPSEKDKSRGVLADLTGWGSGTCAAPEASVIEICQKLDVLDFVETVKGYFENTLPEIKDRVGNIAFMHMDADWYESTKTILKNLYDQVVNDGFIQVDDYGHWDGCREALHEFEKERNLKFNLNQIDYSGVWFSMPKLVNARNV